MAWISFDVFRTLGFSDTLHLKPEQVFQYKAAISKAQWVLFPPYWQLNALQYGLKARVFPSEASYRLGNNKIEMTRAFELVAPHNTPYTRILANSPANAELLWQELHTPFVAKLSRSSQGDGVWLIDSRHDWQNYVSISDTLYVQEYLPIDRDMRIIIIGDKVVSAYWRQQAARGFYNNVAKGGFVDHSPVPQAALDLALQLAKSLAINHAGFDIAMVGDRPYVLEFNRLFGNQGIAGGEALLRGAIVDYLQREGAPFPSRPAQMRRRLRQVA